MRRPSCPSSKAFNNLDDMVARFPKCSLVDQQLLGKAYRANVIIGGVLDTQVPISDIYFDFEQRRRAERSVD